MDIFKDIITLLGASAIGAALVAWRNQAVQAEKIRVLSRDVDALAEIIGTVRAKARKKCADK